MYGLILTLHFIACILLILIVLLQSGKGSAAGIFGASGADNLFASPTAFNAVNKFTAVLAVVLMCTSIALTIASNKARSTSVLDNVEIPAEAPVKTTADTPAETSADTPAETAATPETPATPAK